MSGTTVATALSKKPRLVLEGNYSQIPNRLLELRDMNLMALGLVLCRESIGWGCDSCRLSNAELCEMLGTTVNTLRATRRGLVERGWIELGDTTQRGTLYKVLIPSECFGFVKSPVLAALPDKEATPKVVIPKTAKRQARSTPIQAEGLNTPLIQPVTQVAPVSTKIDNKQAALLTSEIASQEEASKAVVEGAVPQAQPEPKNTPSERKPGDVISTPGGEPLNPHGKETETKEIEQNNTHTCVSASDLDSIQDNPLKLPQSTLNAAHRLASAMDVLRVVLTILISYMASKKTTIMNPAGLFMWSLKSIKKGFAAFSDVEIAEQLHTQIYYVRQYFVIDQKGWSKEVKDEIKAYNKYLSEHKHILTLQELYTSYNERCKLFKDYTGFTFVALMGLPKPTNNAVVLDYDLS